MPRNRFRGGTPGRAAARRRGEEGVSTVEVVIAAPLMMLFIITIFNLGFYAENVAKVQEAAADAARMASVQARSQSGQVGQAVEDTADSDLKGSCAGDDQGDPAITASSMDISLPDNPPAGTTSAQDATKTVEITVSCAVRLLGISYTITESAYAPLDYFSGRQ